MLPKRKKLGYARRFSACLSGFGLPVANTAADKRQMKENEIDRRLDLLLHQDKLFTDRVNLFLASQSILFLSYATFLQVARLDERVLLTIGVFGIIASSIFVAVLSRQITNIERLKRYLGEVWKYYKDERHERPPGRSNWLLGYGLPTAFFFSWVILMYFSLVVGNRCLYISFALWIPFLTCLILYNIVKTTEREPEVRSWLRKHFTSLLILTGSISMIVGTVSLTGYYYAPRYSFLPTPRGFGMASNQTNIQPTTLWVDIQANAPQLGFRYYFQCSTNGTYNFLFTFPFKVIRKDSSTPNMLFNSTSSGSVIWLEYLVEDVSTGWKPEEIWGYFDIDNTFQSGTRGSYTFLFPFENAIDGEAVHNIQRKLGVPFHTQYEQNGTLELQFRLPARYQIIQTFPPLSIGPVPTNGSITRMEWKLKTLRQTVTIYCQDPDEMLLYQSLLFISGLGFGIGVPMFVDGIKEWAYAS